MYTALQRPPLGQSVRRQRRGVVRASASVPSTKELWVLKETASTVAALKAGKQTILLRKGGIREPRFALQSKEFLLQPTQFHLDADLVRPEHRSLIQTKDCNRSTQALQCLAVVTGAWQTKDPQIVEALRELHVWTDLYMSHRLKWRPSVDLTLLEVRCYIVDPPIHFEPLPEHKGCFSWLRISPSSALQPRTKACLSDSHFVEKQERLRSALVLVSCAPLAP